MFNNMSRNSGSVRVILFFLVFVGICVYTPILIDGLIQRGDSDQQRIARGEDPTTVLEHTGAGQMLASDKCNTKEYIYGKSQDGYAFVKKVNTDMYAVDVGGATRFLLLDENGVVVVNAGNNDEAKDINQELSFVLEDCLNSEAVPDAVDISFRVAY